MANIYYINLTDTGLVYPSWLKEGTLFRPMEYRFESWWKRFVKSFGYGLTAIELPDNYKPKNINFYRIELSTIIGNLIDSYMYGNYIVDMNCFLRAVVCTYQDPPINTITLYVMRNGINTTSSFNITPQSIGTSEYFISTSVVPVYLLKGDSIKIKAPYGVSSSGCGNLKIYGVFSE